MCVCVCVCVSLCVCLCVYVCACLCVCVSVHPIWTLSIARSRLCAPSLPCRYRLYHFLTAAKSEIYRFCIESHCDLYVKGAQAKKKKEGVGGSSVVRMGCTHWQRDHSPILLNQVQSCSIWVEPSTLHWCSFAATDCVCLMQTLRHSHDVMETSCNC